VTLLEHITAASETDPATRRVLALVLAHEILRVPPGTPGTRPRMAPLWRALGHLLAQCAVELADTGDRTPPGDRAAYFTRMARQAHALADAVRTPR
jgi:hypothetical protein